MVVGKGFHGAVQVLPLAPPPEVTEGTQQPPVGEVRMLLVGRMLWRKGVLDAVRTLADVRTHVPATLTLAGTGYRAEAAHTLAAELGTADALTLHPWLDARALAELAAGGPLEIITAEVDGLLTAPADVAELATALVRLANDGALRERLGQAAQTRAYEFAPELIGAQMMVLYREMLARPGRRLFGASR